MNGMGETKNTFGWGKRERDIEILIRNLQQEKIWLKRDKIYYISLTKKTLIHIFSFIIMFSYSISGVCTILKTFGFTNLLHLQCISFSAYKEKMYIYISTTEPINMYTYTSLHASLMGVLVHMYYNVCSFIKLRFFHSYSEKKYFILFQHGTE